MFTIDASPMSSSESDSDYETPKFEIPAFHKYFSKSCQSKEAIDNTPIQKKSIKLSSSMDPGIDCETSNYVNAHLEKESIPDQMKRHKDSLKNVLNEHLKKSIVYQDEFEKLEKVPTFQSRRQIRKQGLKEKEKTKGFQWYNMPAPEMTEEKKNDLLVVQMRQALDPKHFYKRSVKTNPKYFEVGTFVESPVDFYSSRIPKKQRKQTLVDELLADAEFQSYHKKKTAEIQKMQPMKFRPQKKVKKTKLLEARYGDSKKKHKKGNK